MDFDNSKENIQPLRGGRNPTQLGVAIQAQNSVDFQRELIQQKQEFENAIQTYTGDDPLENYYNYISWVEQSFPTHGHEGNLLPLLEECLKKFENDQRYVNDRRFCKLWIKLIDYQQNPVEMYHMLYSKGVCRGCAEFYIAWAFYHEVMGDYQTADQIFVCGQQELAQPYDELLDAHKNMIFAAGQERIRGANEERMQQQRNALTSLQVGNKGRVGSVRQSHSGHSGYPGHTVQPGPSSQSQNLRFNVYQENNEGNLGAAAAPSSVFDIAKRDVCTKENFMKPGVWSNVKVGSSRSSHKTSSFPVHEDGFDIHINGLLLPPDFAKSSLATWEDLANVPLMMAEPNDPTKIAKYPKDRVYPGNGVEYSIEEIKAMKYIKPVTQGTCNITTMSNSRMEITLSHSLNELSPNNRSISLNVSCTRDNKHFPIEIAQPHNSPSVHYDQIPNSPYSTTQPNLASPGPFYTKPKMPTTLSHVNPTNAPCIMITSPLQVDNLWSSMNDSDRDTSPVIEPSAKKKINFNIFNDSVSTEQHPVQPKGSAMKSPLKTLSAISEPSAKKKINFNIFNDSVSTEQHQVQPKGSAMKTPLKTLSADDLVETGSRGGLDIAMAAQPIDSARNVINLDEQNVNWGGTSDFESMATPDTQMFNFNLDAMKVSTPQSKSNQNVVRSTPDDSTKKDLFAQNIRLSTIFEESKTFSSDSQGAHSSSNLFNSKKFPSQDQNHKSPYHINLEQNLKANAALRSSLLGEYIGTIPEQPHTPTIESQSVHTSVIHPVVEPTTIVPLMSAPEDPFNPALIETLLERINFPGQHLYGYSKVYDIPRVVAKKDIISVGNQKYYVEKLIGKGAYGSVFKAEDCTTRQTVALKYQRPPSKWEYYICRELQARLPDHMKDWYMDVQKGYFSDQASILISEFITGGSLLDIVNKLKQKTGRVMKESLCAYFCIEMLQLISAMHAVKIIHADIKPDNFLVLLIDNNVKLHLIDFGCSIDMAMFPHGTTFLRKVTTEDFICCEMLDGRPWSYHTDLFCVAACAHVLLFDKYIDMRKKDDHWSIKQRLGRYYRVDCWNMFFSTLLNQQNGPAKVEPLIQMLSASFDMSSTEFQSEMRCVVNIVRGR